MLKGTGLKLVGAEHEDLTILLQWVPKICCLHPSRYRWMGMGSSRRGPAAGSFLLLDPGLRCRTWPCSVLLHAALILSPLWGLFSPFY